MKNIFGLSVVLDLKAKNGTFLTFKVIFLCQKLTIFFVYFSLKKRNQLFEKKICLFSQFFDLAHSPLNPAACRKITLVTLRCICMYTSVLVIKGNHLNEINFTSCFSYSTGPSQGLKIREGKQCYVGIICPSSLVEIGLTDLPKLDNVG